MTTKKLTTVSQAMVVAMIAGVFIIAVCVVLKIGDTLSNAGSAIERMVGR